MGMDRLIDKIVAYKNPTVAGLDPKLSYIPQYIRDAFFNEFEDPFEAAAECLLTFNKALIDALCDIVPAVKPQAAYYEMYGWQGVRAPARDDLLREGKRHARHYRRANAMTSARQWRHMLPRIWERPSWIPAKKARLMRIC